jgi:tetratricopeptide (TPR) repeat protein
VVERAIERTRTARNLRGELRARLDRFWMPPPPDVRGFRENTQIRLEVEELIPALEELGDDAGLTNAWQLVAMSHKLTGHHTNSARALERAMHHAELLADRLEQQEVRGRQLESAYEGPTPVGEAITRCEQALRDSSGEWAVEAAAFACSAGLYAMRGEFHRAHKLVERAAVMAEEFKLWNVRPWYEQGHIAMLAGEFAALESFLVETQRALGRYDVWWGLGFVMDSWIAAALCAQGRYEEAARRTDVMPANPGDWIVSNTVWRSARAQALARIGRPDDAIALAQEAVELSEPTDALNLRGDALLAQADVLIACGREEEGIRSAGAALASYRQKGNAVMAERAAALASPHHESTVSVPSNP